jgi:uncharacterized protein (DUF362 family)/NAD-dependent dihydropyrimidine dehydrogenase PreA subunit
MPALVCHVRAEHGDALGEHVERLVAPFGGWPAIVKPGERIAVKVNLLRGADPEKAVSTHPETLRHVLRGIKSAGAIPFVADSPGGHNPPQKVARYWRISGLAAVCQEEMVELRDVESEAATFLTPEGHSFRSFPVARSFTEADAIVQVGVLKTHVLMRLTGGVKLTFGCMPGLAKAQMHVRVPDRLDFAEMLLDLHLGLAPRFTIIDGVIAMEGQGPGGGKPYPLGSLFAARDCSALDAAIADRTAHERREVHTLAAAAGRGLIDLDCPYELAGDPVLADDRFTAAGRDWEARIPVSWRRVGRRLFTARPKVVDPPACIRCGDCQSICAAEAVRVAELPGYDDGLCVRCYACVEVCPTGAIDAVNPPLVRFWQRLRSGKHRHTNV